MTASRPKAVDAVIFDLGNVLITWDPRHLYRALLPDDAAVETFLSTICTPAWHRQHDLGVPMTRTCAALAARHPDQADLIHAWRLRFGEMLPGPVPGTPGLLAALDQRGVPLYALSNWPRETFPIARARFDFLTRFRDIVISGEVGVGKPDPEIYRILIKRAGLDPRRSLFIDDVAENVAAAEDLGFHGHVFTDADALGRALVALGLLDTI